MGDAERIVEMPRTQSYHEPRGPYYIIFWSLFNLQHMRKCKNAKISVYLLHKINMLYLNLKAYFGPGLHSYYRPLSNLLRFVLELEQCIITENAKKNIVSYDIINMKMNHTS